MRLAPTLENHLDKRTLASETASLCQRVSNLLDFVRFDSRIPVEFEELSIIPGRQISGCAKFRRNINCVRSWQIYYLPAPDLCDSAVAAV